MLNSILMWLVSKILEFLFKKGEQAVSQYIDEQKRDAEMNANNEKAVQKYKETKDRHERVKASLAILNRTNSN